MSVAVIERETQRTVRDHYAFHVYDDVVHVIRTTRVTRCKPRVDEWLISRAEFEANKDKRTFRWVHGKHHLEIATAAYFKCYQDGYRYQLDDDDDFHQFPTENRYEDQKNWPKLLTNGASARVIRDWSSQNGFCYDVNGCIIPRAFWFDYIHGGLTSERIHIPDVLEHLQQQPGVEQAVVINVPHYNGGGKAVEFLYRPSDQYFHRLIKAHIKEKYFGSHSWGLREAMFKRLKLNQRMFQKPPSKREEPDDDAF